MYSLSTTKKIIALAAIIASFSIAAETKELAQIDMVDTEATKNIENEVSELANSEEENIEQANTEEEITELANTEEEITELTNTEEVITELGIVKEESPAITAIGVKSSVKKTAEANVLACPANFYDVKLPTNGKLCQVFAADLPASMIFFVPQLPEEVIAFYEQDTTTFSTTRQVKDRVLLQSEDKNTTLIISTDGSGTQVDVLVKSSNS